MEEIPLHCLQCAPGSSMPTHRWGTPPSHRAQKANIETITKTTLTLESGTRPLTPGFALNSPFSGEGVF